MQRPNHELQARIRECENPTFGYRRGEDGEVEKDIFDGEPLPAGWVDSPAKVDGEVVTAPVEGEETGSPVHPAPDPPLAPPYETHPFNALRAEFKRRTGKVAAMTTSKEGYIALLKELDAQAGQQE